MSPKPKVDQVGTDEPAIWTLTLSGQNPHRDLRCLELSSKSPTSLPFRPNRLALLESPSEQLFEHLFYVDKLFSVHTHLHVVIWSLVTAHGIPCNIFDCWQQTIFRRLIMPLLWLGVNYFTPLGDILTDPSFQLSNSMQLLCSYFYLWIILLA